MFFISKLYGFFFPFFPYLFFKDQRKILRHVWMLKTNFVGDKHCTCGFIQRNWNYTWIVQWVDKQKFHTHFFDHNRKNKLEKIHTKKHTLNTKKHTLNTKNIHLIPKKHTLNTKNIHLIQKKNIHLIQKTTHLIQKKHTLNTKKHTLNTKKHTQRNQKNGGSGWH